MLTPHLITAQWPLDDVTLGEIFQSYPTRRVVRLQAAQGEFVAKVDTQPPAYAAACQPYALFDFLAAPYSRSLEDS